MLNFNELQQNIEQINNFQRGAKKKSSLKTTKTNYKDLHNGALRSTGKMKSLKWDSKETEHLKNLENKPNSNRKKLDEVKTHYIAYVTIYKLFYVI